MMFLHVLASVSGLLERFGTEGATEGPQFQMDPLYVPLQQISSAVSVKFLPANIAILTFRIFLSQHWGRNGRVDGLCSPVD